MLISQYSSPMIMTSKPVFAGFGFSFLCLNYYHLIQIANKITTIFQTELVPVIINWKQIDMVIKFKPGCIPAG